MTRIRIGAAALGLAALLSGGVALAQETTGRVTGRVTDQETGMPLGGVTVIVAGPQGEDAVITTDKGEYTFTTLPVGTYVIRFYAANTATQVEQPGVIVSADRMVRVNAKISSAAVAAAQQTYLITGKAPSIDIGSARVGADFDSAFTQNVPVGRTFGDVIERAPGAFIDGSGNVSIGGATGLENMYFINGMNVTGIRYGNIDSGLASHGAGSNLPTEFVTQIDVNSGGYQAEYGGAMGGVINTVLKSGTNEIHGSAFGYWSPYWLAASPKLVLPIGSSLGGVRKPDFDDSIGVEVGGPLIKDKLFFWVGFAPRITDTHVLRTTYAQTEDPNNPGFPILNASGQPAVTQTPWTARMQETHRTYSYAGTIDWIPLPDNHLTLALVGTPSFNTELKNQYGVDPYSSDPRTALESMTKANTDLSAHWVSKLYERRWQIDVLAGMHNEYFYDRSPYADLNNLNQLQYSGANLWDLEHATGCAPSADGFQPCPVAPYYYGGGIGEIDKANAFRWSGEIKSTHLFEGGGHHELKYGWHIDLGTYDLTRSYSGPPGEHAFVQITPGSGFGAQTFFGLMPGESQVTVDRSTLGTGSKDYVDSLHAYVKNLANSFFLQDSFSPNHLRNLTINAGVRLELQKMYGSDGNPVFSTDDLAPRLGVVYDPWNDGRSKLAVFYGRYYEAVPLDVAARYFAGENFVNSNGNLSACSPSSLGNAYNWVGNGEYAKCGPTTGAFAVFNNETAQANMQGQYNNEVTATAEREILPGMTLRLDYQHRWLGTVIEDGAGPNFNSVLANPGHVPDSAITAANNDIQQAKTALQANQMDPVAQANLQNAQAKLSAIQQLAAAPTPERTYDAITLSLNKHFSKAWFARAAYTYSRLIGNYEGLYQNETNYIAPNGSNAYDYPDLYPNQNGPLPNDRPHLFKVDGYYTLPVGRGQFVFGTSFTARSGMPRNYMGNLLPNQPYQIVFLLPRGDAGRTPTVTELDAHVAYGRPLGPKMKLEGFIDVFNMLDQQTALQQDDNYTYDAAAPIINGTPQDLKYAKNMNGAPVAKNPNFGRPLAYQTPINARLGLRLTF